MATLRDIAAEVNLSVSTVSLILNNKGKRIHPKTALLVKETAKRLDYHPNAVARSLVQKRSMTVGLIVPDIQNIFFAELAKHISDFFKSKGYTLLLCNTDYDRREDIRQLNTLRANSVAGIIGVLTNSDDVEYMGEIDKMILSGMPFIMLDRAVEGCDAPYIGTDNRYGAYIAIKHLLDNHHRNIAIITGPSDSVSATRRLEGYKEALADAGIPFNENLVFKGDYQSHSGYLAGKEILKDKRITAVFASNDMMAYGVYKAVREANKVVGCDLSVVGFDDLPFSEMLEVPLTSVSQNTSEIAVYAAERLLAEIKGIKEECLKTLTPPVLSVRKSVADLI